MPGIDFFGMRPTHPGPVTGAGPGYGHGDFQKPRIVGSRYEAQQQQQQSISLTSNSGVTNTTTSHNKAQGHDHQNQIFNAFGNVMPKQQYNYSHLNTGSAAQAGQGQITPPIPTRTGGKLATKRTAYDAFMAKVAANQNQIDLGPTSNSGIKHSFLENALKLGNNSQQEREKDSAPNISPLIQGSNNTGPGDDIFECVLETMNLTEIVDSSTGKVRLVPRNKGSGSRKGSQKKVITATHQRKITERLAMPIQASARLKLGTNTSIGRIANSTGKMSKPEIPTAPTSSKPVNHIQRKSTGNVSQKPPTGTGSGSSSSASNAVSGPIKVSKPPSGRSNNSIRGANNSATGNTVGTASGQDPVQDEVIEQQQVNDKIIIESEIAKPMIGGPESEMRPGSSGSQNARRVGPAPSPGRNGNSSQTRTKLKNSSGNITNSQSKTQRGPSPNLTTNQNQNLRLNLGSSRGYSQSPAPPGSCQHRQPRPKQSVTDSKGPGSAYNSGQKAYVLDSFSVALGSSTRHGALLQHVAAEREKQLEAQRKREAETDRKFNQILQTLREHESSLNDEKQQGTSSANESESLEKEKEDSASADKTVQDQEKQLVTNSEQSSTALTKQDLKDSESDPSDANKVNVRPEKSESQPGEIKDTSTDATEVQNAKTSDSDSAANKPSSKSESGVMVESESASETNNSSKKPEKTIPSEKDAATVTESESKDANKSKNSKKSKSKSKDQKKPKSESKSKQTKSTESESDKKQSGDKPVNRMRLLADLEALETGGPLMSSASQSSSSSESENESENSVNSNLNEDQDQDLDLDKVNSDKSESEKKGKKVTDEDDDDNDDNISTVDDDDGEFAELSSKSKDNEDGEPNSYTKSKSEDKEEDKKEENDEPDTPLYCRFLQPNDKIYMESVGIKKDSVPTTSLMLQLNQSGTWYHQDPYDIPPLDKRCLCRDLDESFLWIDSDVEIESDVESVPDEDQQRYMEEMAAMEAAQQHFEPAMGRRALSF